MNQNVGLTFELNSEFVKKNKDVMPKFIRENIVTEVVISAVTAITNGVSLPCVVEYTSNSGKTGDAIVKSWSETKKVLQICESSQKSIS